MVPPILWLGNKTFAQGVRARNLEFVQHPRSGAHVQSLEAERVSAEVVDEIAEPTRKRERVSGKGKERYTSAKSLTQ